MSLRLPQNLTPAFEAKSGLTQLEMELKAEQASSLGAVGRAVKQQLDALEKLKDADPAVRAVAIDNAAREVWQYFIQREMCGLTDHQDAIETYGIPKAVLARLGAVS